MRTGTREINTRTEAPDNKLLPAAQSQTNYYAAASLLQVGESQAPFLVGDGQISMLNGMTFENVRLSAEQSYVFFARAYSSQIVSLGEMEGGRREGRGGNEVRGGREGGRRRRREEEER